MEHKKNKHAQALARLSKGVPKRLSDAERARRATVMNQNRRARTKKVVEL